MKLRFAALLAPFLLAASPAAAANSALDEARALTSKATVEYDVGHFDQALELYTSAPRESIRSASRSLFDIAQCHRLLGHFERAIFFFHGYLRECSPTSAEPRAGREAPRRLAEAARRPEGRPTRRSGSEARPRMPPLRRPRPRRRRLRHRPRPRTTRISTTAVLRLPPRGTEIARAAHRRPPPRPASAWSSSVSAHSKGCTRSRCRTRSPRCRPSDGTWNQRDESNYNSGKSAASAATILFVMGGVAVEHRCLAHPGSAGPGRTRSPPASAPLPRGLSAGPSRPLLARRPTRRRDLAGVEDETGQTPPSHPSHGGIGAALAGISRTPSSCWRSRSSKPCNALPGAPHEERHRRRRLAGQPERRGIPPESTTGRVARARSR